MAKRKFEDQDESVEHRSGYGDQHTHRDAEMMKQHLAHMRSAGKIDQTMAAELLKPLDRPREYTAEYLATLPTYTGEQPEMESLETAERNQRKRDKEQLKFIKAFKAGLIDEHGNSLGLEGGDDAVEDEDEEHTGATTGGKTLSIRSRKPFLTTEVILSASPSPGPASAPASHTQGPKRKRKRPAKVDPLTPLPGGRTYEGYSYNQLAAVGRERSIYTPGSAAAIRNALIQDDINVAQNLPRNIAEWKKNVESYKRFKTEVPEELKTVAPAPAEEDEDEEDKGDAE